MAEAPGTTDFADGFCESQLVRANFAVISNAAVASIRLLRLSLPNLIEVD